MIVVFPVFGGPMMSMDRAFSDPSTVRQSRRNSTLPVICRPTRIVAPKGFPSLFLMTLIRWRVPSMPALLSKPTLNRLVICSKCSSVTSTEGSSWRKWGPLDISSFSLGRSPLSSTNSRRLDQKEKESIITIVKDGSLHKKASPVNRELG